MTKEEILQKVEDYCTEKQYTNATLTDAFKGKFADHFLKANPDGDINDEGLLANMKFALNTAFSSASELATVKSTEFSTKENELKNQIAELQKKIPQQQQQQQQFELPDEVKNQLEELKKFKDAQTRQEKKVNILKLAKSEIRRDLHESFEEFASDYAVVMDKEDKEQADGLVAKFQSIFKGTIGSIKPMQPQQTQKQDEEFLKNIPVVSVK